MSDKIKVMIIDDSALIRNLVTKMLTECGEIEVVGTALNGKFGLQKLPRLNPDIIVLDLEMPEMNGIEFLKERKKLGITTPVIILSSIAKKGAAITLEALSLGASDFVLKPSESGSDIGETKTALTEMIIGLARTHAGIQHKIPEMAKSNLQQVATMPPPKIDPEKAYKLAPLGSIPPIHIIAIGISTGGPNALRDMLPLFPADFPVPIVIVQHMPPGFTLEFAHSLDKICQLDIKEAEDGDVITKGRVLIAPGGMHMRLERKQLATVIKLGNEEPVNGHKPSCDVLFESVAQNYGNNSIGCIMTGMGKDGAEKLGSILQKGGITIGQDKASSVVYGMPQVAFNYGNLQIVRPLSELASTIMKITNGENPNV